MEYEEFDPYESDGYAPDSDVCHGSPFVEVQIFIDEFDPFQMVAIRFRLFNNSILL